jgi:hypothetical protein
MTTACSQRCGSRSPFHVQRRWLLWLFMLLWLLQLLLLLSADAHQSS